MIENELPRDETSVENNRRRRRKEHQNELHDSSSTSSHKDDIQNSEDTRRRGRRRGHRRGRRNQNNGFYPSRVPYAEPVGEFAKQALEEIKAAHRLHSIPAAEPVGFDEQISDAKHHISVQQNSALKSKKRRNVRSPKVSQGQKNLENNKSVTTSTLVGEKNTTNSVHKSKTKK